MRGEHKRFVRSAFMYSGSYPHARGAPGVRVLEEALRGIIPACAGSTGRRKGLVLMVGGSSPHARGAPIEHPSALVPSRDHPRMRGEHCNDERGRVLARGIIPACAGSTSAMLAFDSRIWGSSPHARGARTRGAGRDRRPRDHPRMRGEHHIRLLAGRRFMGIIPACAGSTLANRCSGSREGGSSPHARGARLAQPRKSSIGWDHPRMRGEHDEHPALNHATLRIIPACAGSTLCPASTWILTSGSSPHARGALKSGICPNTTSWDHPRMRGEHVVVRNLELALDGIIPAYAGSTTVEPSKVAPLRDHPRMRGEH